MLYSLKETEIDTTDASPVQHSSPEKRSHNIRSMQKKQRT